MTGRTRSPSPHFRTEDLPPRPCRFRSPPGLRRRLRHPHRRRLRHPHRRRLRHLWPLCQTVPCHRSLTTPLIMEERLILSLIPFSQVRVLLLFLELSTSEQDGITTPTLRPPRSLSSGCWMTRHSADTLPTRMWAT